MNKMNGDEITLTNINMKILRKGKVNIGQNTKIYLGPYIKISIENTICKKLSDIDSFDMTNNCGKINHYFDQISIEGALSFLSMTNPDITYTSGVITSKKNFDKLFSFKGDSIINYLYRVSTLPAIHQYIESEIRKHENKTIDSDDAIVIYIPDILIYLDKRGNVIHQPYTINLLLVVVPSYKMMKESENINRFEVGRRYVDDLCDAALKCGVKNLVIDPFCHKRLLKNANDISNYWLEKEDIYDMRTHIDSISYCVPTKYYSTLFKMSSGMNGFIDLIV